MLSYRALFAILLVVVMPAQAEDRCTIRYSVRLEQPGQGVDTGSSVRSFSTCVSNLTYCHTHAETLARAHAEEHLTSENTRPDAESLSIVDIETSDDCD